MERCENCKREFPLELLDSKPKSLARVKCTEADLASAADRGEDFEVLQCKECYGPAWLPV
jgi:hypothetical protein